MKRQTVDVVIGNNRTICFDGFDNATAITLDIPISKKMVLFQSVSNMIGAHLEYLCKKLVTTSSPKNSKNMDLQQSLRNLTRTGARARVGKQQGWCCS